MHETALIPEVCWSDFPGCVACDQVLLARAAIRVGERPVETSSLAADSLERAAE